jgi:hypothetical protein
MNPSEYEELGIKIRDKNSLEIKISNKYNIGDITYQQQ